MGGESDVESDVTVITISELYGQGMDDDGEDAGEVEDAALSAQDPS